MTGYLYARDNLRGTTFYLSPPAGDTKCRICALKTCKRGVRSHCNRSGSCENQQRFAEQEGSCEPEMRLDV